MKRIAGMEPAHPARCLGGGTDERRAVSRLTCGAAARSAGSEDASVYSSSTPSPGRETVSRLA